MRCRSGNVVLFSLLLCGAQVGSGRVEATDGAAPDFSRLEAVAQEELKATGTPGAAVAVVRGDRVVYARGFGVASVETGQPVTADSLFRLGSTTKMFTAAALVRLSEQGKLRLDAPVGELVTGLPPRIAPLTPHELLSHTAGLKDVAPMEGLHDDSALAANVRAWTDDYCFTEPRQIYSYSNPGYVLAGLAAERAAGKPFADVVAEQLFHPLGMKRTTFRPTLAMTYPLALGHNVENGKPAVVRPFADYAGAWPAGSMFSSANDLSRWMLAFLNEGRLDGKPVLSPELIRKLSTSYATIPGATETRYGYGLRLEPFRGVRMVNHTGSRLGFGSVMRLVPEHRFGVVVLGNRSGVNLVRTATTAMELLLPLQPMDATPPPAAVVLPEEQLGTYAGTYANPPARVTVTLKEGKLHLQQMDAEREMAPLGEHRFRLGGAGDPAQVVFTPGPDGRPRYLSRGGRAYRRQ